MPLIDLQTDLKSLKFGKDRPGGGSSNQPYIKKDIPGGDASNLASTGGPDFLLRGGILAPVRAVNDVSRLTQMFFDLKTPSGPLFIAKENLLSRTSVKTEASFGVGYGGGAVNQGIYTPLSTIGQALVGIAGGHLNLLGVDPTGLTDFGLNKYQDVVKFNDDANNNRLVNLLNNEDPVNILTYPGGPGSILGIGDTNIKFADQRTGYNNKLAIKPPLSTENEYSPNKQYFYKGGIKLHTPSTSSFNIVASSGSSYQYTTLTGTSLLSSDYYNTETGAKLWNNSIYNSGSTFPGNNNDLLTQQYTNVYSQQQIIDQERNLSNGIQDFRDNLVTGTATESSFVMSLAPNYKTKNIENRVNLGNPGTRKDKLRYSTSTDILDKITASPIYTAPIGEHEGDLNDLVKFSIGLVNNDDTGNSTFMNFRAFLDSFSDTYGADWGETQYVGRADKFYNYRGFNRSINLSWTVMAQSKAELIPMYKKLNYLASGMAPTYSTGGFMQGNLARLTVGGYIFNQLGIIKGITYDVPQEAPWEIAIDEFGFSDRSVKELPHMIKVTGFEFVPIQDFVPARGERFISLSNGYNNNYDS